MPYLTFSYWLPCGRFNFCRPKKLGLATVEPRLEEKGKTLDVLTYLERVIDGCASSYKAHQYSLVPLALKGDQTAEPDSILITLNALRQGANNLHRRKIIVANDDGVVVVASWFSEEHPSEEDCRAELDEIQKILTSATLPYFQNNLLFQGLYSGAMHAGVFLKRGSEAAAGLGASETLANRLPKMCATSFFRAALPIATDANVRNSHQALTDHCRIPALRAFLRSSARELQDIKWAVEEVRRRLLEHTLGRTDLRERKMGSPDESDAQIRSTTETQLRAYVMFLAAKFPLIDTTYRYLGMAMKKGATSGGASPNNLSDNLQELWVSWEMTLQGCASNIAALQDAIDQSQRDRSLYEQEQVRAEQEAVAEMERFREGTIKPSYETAGLAAMISANIFALCGAFVAFCSPSSTSNSLPSPTEPNSPSGGSSPAKPLPSRGNGQRGSSISGTSHKPSSIPQDGTQSLATGTQSTVRFPALANLTKSWTSVAWLMAGVVVISIVTYKICLFILKVADRFNKFRGHDRMVFYEFNIRIDREMSSEVAQKLLGRIWEPFEQGVKLHKPRIVMNYVKEELVPETFPELRSRTTFLSGAYFRSLRMASGKSWWWALKDLTWSSYRVERAGKDEALHKVHADLKFDIRRTRKWFTPKIGKGDVSLVYEILKHVPSNQEESVLRELRVTVRSPRKLATNEINRLQQAIVEFFIRPLLLEKNLRLDDRTDVMMVPLVVKGKVSRLYSQAVASVASDQTFSSKTGPEIL